MQSQIHDDAYAGTDGTQLDKTRPSWLRTQPDYNIIVTGFEKRRLPRTQQQDTLFTIKR